MSQSQATTRVYNRSVALSVHSRPQSAPQGAGTKLHCTALDTVRTSRSINSLDREIL